MLAGARVPAHWLDAHQIHAALPLSLLDRLQFLDWHPWLPGDTSVGHAEPLRPEDHARLPGRDHALPRAGAHDAWLHTRLLHEATLPIRAQAQPSALYALRRVGDLSWPGTGWLLEPVHFHPTRDHLVMVHGACAGASPDEFQTLMHAVAPVLADLGLRATALGASADLWHLALASPSPHGGRGLDLFAAALDAAAGRNVDAYLPVGAGARRWRRALNEIQMTWFDHPVNQARLQRGQPTINSVWLSGPVTGEWHQLWRMHQERSPTRVDTRLLECRLTDDRDGWLDTLCTVLSEHLDACQDAARVHPRLWFAGDIEAGQVVRRTRWQALVPRLRRQPPHERQVQALRRLFESESGR